MNGTHDRHLTAARSQGLDDQTNALLAQLGKATDEQCRQQLRDEIITRTIPVADRLAARYGNRGILLDDLRQVARTALVQAMNRFDGSDEHPFLAYAVPCIRGELRRYFRDAGWVVRPPRRVQEARLALTEAQGDLRQGLGREPDADELAEHTGIPHATIRDALGVGHCYQPDSLDRPAGDDAQTAVGDRAGQVDPAFRRAEARVLIEPLLESLEPRDRMLIILRFFEGLTQRDTGQRIGISQMQVSRVESRILQTFRATLAA